MYHYYSPLEAEAVVEQYERTVAENRAACEAMREMRNQAATTQTKRSWRTSWLARRTPLALFTFHRHA